MNVLRLVLLGCIALLSQACAITGSVQPVYTPMEVSHSKGETYTAAPGDIIYREKQPVTIPGATLQASIDKYVWSIPGAFKVDQGSILFESEDTQNQQTVYCSRDVTVTDAIGAHFARACFRDIDKDGQFEIMEALMRGNGRVSVTKYRSQIDPVPYTLGDVPIRDVNFEYVILFEEATDGSLGLTAVIREQESGCVHERGETNIKLSAGFPAEGYIPTPLLLDHVMDEPGTAKRQLIPQALFSPYFDTIDDLARSNSHRIQVLAWEQGQLEYQIDPVSDHWSMSGGRPGFDRCGLDTATAGL